MLHRLKSVFFKKHWWTKKRVIVFLLLLAVSIVMSVVHGSKQDTGGDFYVFWLSGKHFLEGSTLYDVPEGARPFIYPPFAAMLFAVFTLLPLKVSAGLFYFINILLFVVSIYLTYRIFVLLYSERPFKKLPLIFAVLFSARFFFNNMGLLQINEVVFIVCLGGIYTFLINKNRVSGPLFVIASFIKIVPLFFVGWLLVRGRKSVVLPIVVSSIICFSLPVLLRGFDTGMQDWKEYNRSFLSTFQEGKVVTSYTNQNLAAALYRMALPIDNSENLNYQIASLSEKTVEEFYKIISVLILILFIGNIVFLRIKRADITAFEISSIFLVGHLLSGITWKAHLVTFIFIFMTFFSVDYKALKNFPKAVMYFIAFLIALVGLTGRDVIGSTLHYYSGGYSIIVWMMVMLFMCSIWFSIKPRVLGVNK